MPRKRHHKGWYLRRNRRQPRKRPLCFLLYPFHQDHLHAPHYKETELRNYYSRCGRVSKVKETLSCWRA